MARKDGRAETGRRAVNCYRSISYVEIVIKLSSQRSTVDASGNTVRIGRISKRGRKLTFTLLIDTVTMPGAKSKETPKIRHEPRW